MSASAVASHTCAADEPHKVRKFCAGAFKEQHQESLRRRAFTVEPTDDLNPNPIVAMAMRIRARRDLGAAIDSATPQGEHRRGDDAAASLASFADTLRAGTTRLNSILGESGVTFVRLEQPLRVRLRFAAKRVSLDLDRERQLVIVRGLGLDGEYQFDTGASVPALINLSKLSTEAGYGDALTPSVLLKTIATDAELPRPAHLDALGPIQ